MAWDNDTSLVRNSIRFSVIFYKIVYHISHPTKFDILQTSYDVIQGIERKTESPWHPKQIIMNTHDLTISDATVTIPSSIYLAGGTGNLERKQRKLITAGWYVREYKKPRGRYYEVRVLVEHTLTQMRNSVWVSIYFFRLNARYASAQEAGESYHARVVA